MGIHAFGPSSSGSSSASGVDAGNQKVSWDSLLAAAIDASSKESADHLQFAWESDFYKEIFQATENDTSLAWESWLESAPVEAIESGDDQVIARLDKKRKAACVDITSPICFSIIKKSDEIAWAERRNAEADRALNRWLYIVNQWSNSEPELEVCEAVLSCSSTARQKEILKDWLHSKAPGTLLKRVNALLRYHRAVGWGSVLEGLPYSEEQLYNHMSDSRTGGAKLSPLRSLREALVFVRHVVGLT